MSTKFVFFGPIVKTRWPPWPLIGRDIFDFSSETTEPNSMKLDRISTPSTKCVFFGPFGKTKWPPWPLIGWDIFDFSEETAERNSTKLDWKQDLNALYQVCVFQVDRKNKMAAPIYDLLRHFQLFLWCCWIEFNKTLQEDLNILYQACVFQADQKNKIAALSSDWLSHLWLLLWNHQKEFNESWQKTSCQRPLPSFCFLGWSKKQYGRPGLWLAETYFDFSSETAERNSAKLDRKQDLNVLYQVCVFRAETCRMKCCCFLVPFRSQIFEALIVLRWAIVALWASCYGFFAAGGMRCFTNTSCKVTPRRRN